MPRCCRNNLHPPLPGTAPARMGACPEGRCWKARVRGTGHSYRGTGTSAQQVPQPGAAAELHSGGACLQHSEVHTGENLQEPKARLSCTRAAVKESCQQVAVCEQGMPRCKRGQQRLRMVGSARQSPGHTLSTTSPMADADRGVGGLCPQGCVRALEQPWGTRRHCGPMANATELPGQQGTELQQGSGLHSSEERLACSAWLREIRGKN